MFTLFDLFRDMRLKRIRDNFVSTVLELESVGWIANCLQVALQVAQNPAAVVLENVVAHEALESVQNGI